MMKFIRYEDRSMTDSNTIQSNTDAIKLKDKLELKTVCGHLMPPHNGLACPADYSIFTREWTHLPATKSICWQRNGLAGTDSVLAYHGHHAHRPIYVTLQEKTKCSSSVCLSPHYILVKGQGWGQGREHLEVVFIIITITDLYSAFRSEDTEALDGNFAAIDYYGHMIWFIFKYKQQCSDSGGVICLLAL